MNRTPRLYKPARSHLKSLLWLGVTLIQGVGLQAVAQTGSTDTRTIQNVRFGDKSQQTRLVIDVDAPISCSWFTLAGTKKRLVIDLPRVRWSLNARVRSSGAGKGLGQIAGYRYAHLNATTSRLVLDLAEPMGVSNHFAIPASRQKPVYRLVFDLEPVSKQTFDANAGQSFSLVAKAKASKQTKVSKQTKASKQTRVPPSRPIIVIDPGHGGKDPGARGVAGSREKDINLGIAKELAHALRKTGRYRVELTRTDDTYLELGERVEKARSFNADLFVSLHADAGANVRGASVYTLSSRGAKRADRMRLSHDWVLPVERDNKRPEEVNGVLVDLIQTETKNQSARFAHKLIPALKAEGWPLLRRSHRNAGFFVLLAPDVPAVLLEMGFLTNAKDEQALKSPKLRKPLIRGTIKAINAFFAEQDLYLANR